jgi:hypothetical protein
VRQLPMKWSATAESLRHADVSVLIYWLLFWGGIVQSLPRTAAIFRSTEHPHQSCNHS